MYSRDEFEIFKYVRGHTYKVCYNRLEFTAPHKFLLNFLLLAKEIVYLK
jgi:hypothetical protein